ncbi:ChaN family lipoprotein [Myxococcus sp. MxC21-1]|uniref:ChaN family lipoprotein n=1 Tax=Myxococcus sp. MxC21-1 TaxID=3041439 RepID=UPI00292DD435|nr:ChaN family lipoprotein [Myxococcus sp. MxC21-1]WNZ60261.1 ChaN family lipoprotein [Myxococcus sp. MxC21-1]
MLDVGQQAAVDASLAQAPRDAEALALAVNWAGSGWPDWALYRPVFAAGLEAGLPIIAANLPRSQVRDLVMRGPEALAPELRQRLSLDTPLPEPVEQAMRQEQDEAHCGHLPQEMLGPMVQAQRARDAHRRTGCRTRTPARAACSSPATAMHGRTGAFPRSSRPVRPARTCAPWDCWRSTRSWPRRRTTRPLSARNPCPSTMSGSRRRCPWRTRARRSSSAPRSNSRGAWRDIANTSGIRRTWWVATCCSRCASKDDRAHPPRSTVRARWKSSGNGASTRTG